MIRSDGFNLKLAPFYPEMEIDQGENKTLEVLHEVEKGSESLRILILLHLGIRPNLRCLQGHFLLPHSHHQFLLPYLIRFRPLRILAVQNTTF